MNFHKIDVRHSTWARGILVTCLFFVATAGHASELELKSYPIPGHGKLELKVPTDWEDSIQQPPGDLPPTLRFIPKDGRFKLLVTVLWSKKPDPKFTSPERLESAVNSMGQRALSSAKETTLDVAEIAMKDRGTIGYVYMLTDKAPAPGSYEYLEQGIFATGEFQLAFTLLMHEMGAPSRPVHKMLSTARQVESVTRSKGSKKKRKAP